MTTIHTRNNGITQRRKPPRTRRKLPPGQSMDDDTPLTPDLPAPLTHYAQQCLSENPRRWFQTREIRDYWAERGIEGSCRAWNNAVRSLHTSRKVVSSSNRGDGGTAYTWNRNRDLALVACRMPWQGSFRAGAFGETLERASSYDVGLGCVPWK